MLWDTCAECGHDSACAHCLNGARAQVVQLQSAMRRAFASVQRASHDPAGRFGPAVGEKPKPARALGSSNTGGSAQCSIAIRAARGAIGAFGRLGRHAHWHPGQAWPTRDGQQPVGGVRAVNEASSSQPQEQTLA